MAKAWRHTCYFKPLIRNTEWQIALWSKRHLKVSSLMFSRRSIMWTTALQLISESQRSQKLPALQSRAAVSLQAVWGAPAHFDMHTYTCMHFLRALVQNALNELQSQLWMNKKDPEESLLLQFLPVVLQQNFSNSHEVMESCFIVF